MRFSQANLIVNNKGFTLVELMIVIAVIAVLAAVGMTGMSTWNENARIRNVAQSIVNGLQQARAHALKSNADVIFTLTGNNWTIGCVTATATCPASIEQYTADTLSTNITAAITPAANTTVTFSPLGVINNAASGFNTINVTSSESGTRALRIEVGVGGSARLCDPSIAIATSPRGCN